MAVDAEWRSLDLCCAGGSFFLLGTGPSVALPFLGEQNCARDISRENARRSLGDGGRGLGRTRHVQSHWEKSIQFRGSTWLDIGSSSHLLYKPL